MESWHEQQDDLAVCMAAHPATRASTLRTPIVLSVGERGGGSIVLLHKEGIAAKRLSFSVTPTTFELLGALLMFADSTVVVVYVYRPGGESVGGEFYEKLSLPFWNSLQPTAAQSLQPATSIYTSTSLATHVGSTFDLEQSHHRTYAP